jgi:hypothetical protein
MTTHPISEQRRQYPTQAEIEAGLRRAHRLRSEAFHDFFGALAQSLTPRKQTRPAPLPQPVRAAHC